MQMKNSLSLPAEEVKKLLDENARHVVRIKMPANETISFTDMIHHEVSFDSSLVDDKVLLKADGMPTYHLAVVVDDYLMKITHAFRGEEWLSSAPVHILLWKYLFGLDKMPQWAHLPLILGPSGKLSKRDGAKYGFPVFAMNWADPKTNELTEGFKERGFLPEAFINLLAVLGWNDGTEQEIYNMDELIENFSIDRVHAAGAKFDFEKAKWFNHEWIKKLEVKNYKPQVKILLENIGIVITDDEKFETILELVKDRCVLLNDFVKQASFFFEFPEMIDLASINPKWDSKKNSFFHELVKEFDLMETWQSTDLEEKFKSLASSMEIKAGELMAPFRIMLVGGKFGPPIFNIADILGKKDTIRRIQAVLKLLQ
jgi:glutamyl-tRNA synthetase